MEKRRGAAGQLECKGKGGHGMGKGGGDERVKEGRIRFRVTMRAWPVARSIFDAPSLCERSERADNKLDKRS